MRRRSPLKRTKALRHARRPKAGGQIEAQLWREGLGRCAMNGRTLCEGKVSGHHIVTRQALRWRGLDEHLFDKRNRIPLCTRHHARHHSRLEPVPRCVLPPAVLEFATEHELMLQIERYYPTVEEVPK